MKYNNPVIKGFYPDPSVCKVGDTYYLVCSSFQYFPGVPLFESKDLINWQQIGHVLTRKNQVKLDKVNSSGGVFAPTIRYYNGRFYMTTTNDTTRENFYVWTDDIYGEWSDPIYVDQGGIDPSLYFEDDRTYFMSNGEDDFGKPGIVQCEIDIKTGTKLSKSLTIWQGTGGRFLESPHMYKINGEYYLMASEGGTEFGHTITYARGKEIFGPFEPYKNNPVLTNRNMGGYEIQGAGHGDLIQDNNGNWWIIHLGFRQIGQWMQYHHLGREVFLTPVTFDSDDWFTAGKGYAEKVVETERISEGVLQLNKNSYNFKNTDWDKDWCYLRHPHEENYVLGKDTVKLRGTDITLDDVDSPTFIGLRQVDFCADISCTVKCSDGEAGITVYMSEDEHYDLAIRKTEDSFEIIEELNVGDLCEVKNRVKVESDTAKLIIRANNNFYQFFAHIHGEEIMLGSAQTKYLSTEVSGGFTGVIIGLYAQNGSGKEFSEFADFSVDYGV